MKAIRFVILALCLCCTSAMAVGHMEKGDYLLHTQPNGTTTFYATTWGISFIPEYETDDGYTIVTGAGYRYNEINPKFFSRDVFFS